MLGGGDGACEAAPGLQRRSRDLNVLLGVRGEAASRVSKASQANRGNATYKAVSRPLNTIIRQRRTHMHTTRAGLQGWREESKQYPSKEETDECKR